MRVAITGGTGFLGVPLQELLRGAGHDVEVIGRAPPGRSRPDIVWNPEQGQLDAASLEGVDAVVHLAGESIGQRWTPAVKARIRESRLSGTSLIATTVARLVRPPRVLVSMSGVGIYGDRGDERLTEASAPGGGFLGALAVEWEAAAEPARAAGIRVVWPRLGIVLHHSGGALAKMLPPFRLGLGGRIGAGTQWMSWISRTDAIRAIAFAIEQADLEGPVNLVAPHPITNADFTGALARAVHRPALFPVPAAAIRLAFGEMGVETVLGGQRALPMALERAAFSFLHPTLDVALADALR